MIIKEVEGKNYVLQSPNSQMVAYYEFDLSAETELKISEVFFNGTHNPEVIVHTLGNGSWSHITYTSIEVVADILNKIISFMSSPDTSAILGTDDVSEDK